MFLSIQDPAVETSKGYQKGDSIAVWSRNGRHSLNPKDYTNIVEAFKPDIYVSLCDADTDEKSSSRRIDKSLERSKNQFFQCLERHDSSEILKSKGFLGSVVGGYDLEAREKSIKYLRDKQLEGYVIDGLHINGSGVEKMSFEKIKNIIEHTMVSREKLLEESSH